MTTLKELGLIAVCGVLVYMGGCLGERDRQQARFTRDSLAVVRTIDSLQVQAAKLDTVFIQDTVRFAQWRDRWRVLRDTVLSEKTTLISDTVFVERVLRVADSTIQACSDALQTCADRGRVISLQRDSLVSLNARLHRKPSRFGCVAGATYTLGDLVDHRPLGDVASRIGVSCGLRLRLF